MHIDQQQWPLVLPAIGGVVLLLQILAYYWPASSPPRRSKLQQAEDDFVRELAEKEAAAFATAFSPPAYAASVMRCKAGLNALLAVALLFSVASGQSTRSHTADLMIAVRCFCSCAKFELRIDAADVIGGRFSIQLDSRDQKA